MQNYVNIQRWAIVLVSLSAGFPLIVMVLQGLQVDLRFIGRAFGGLSFFVFLGFIYHAKKLLRVENVDGQSRHVHGFWMYMLSLILVAWNISLWMPVLIGASSYFGFWIALPLFGLPLTVIVALGIVSCAFAKRLMLSQGDAGNAPSVGY